jgi:hypothetical protein
MPYKQGKRPHRRLEGRWKVSIGVGIFLMVLGAILAFAVEATTPGIKRTFTKSWLGGCAREPDSTHLSW